MVSTDAVCVLGVWQTNPLLCGTYTYDVRVQASFNGGVSLPRFGPSCTVGITNNQPAPYCTTRVAPLMEQTDAHRSERWRRLYVYPNPNDGSRLFLRMGSIADDVTTIRWTSTMPGKRASTRTLPVSGCGHQYRDPVGRRTHRRPLLRDHHQRQDVRTERLISKNPSMMKPRPAMVGLHRFNWRSGIPHQRFSVPLDDAPPCPS